MNESRLIFMKIVSTIVTIHDLINFKTKNNDKESIIFDICIEHVKITK